MQEVLERSRKEEAIHSQYMENVFDRTKKSFSNPESTEHTDWKTMWEALFERGLCPLYPLENRTEQGGDGFTELDGDFADKILRYDSQHKYYSAFIFNSENKFGKDLLCCSTSNGLIVIWKREWNI